MFFDKVHHLLVRGVLFQDFPNSLQTPCSVIQGFAAGMVYLFMGMLSAKGQQTQDRSLAGYASDFK